MLARPAPAARGIVRRLSDEAGFGLIEMTIAMMILAIGISALGGLFVSGNLALRRASKQDTATVLADRALEQFRAIKFNDIALNDSLVGAAGRDSTYANDPALSGGTTDITTTGSPCSGGVGSMPITCYPTRTVSATSDTVTGTSQSTGSGQTSPDGHAYRIDAYVTLGCPDGSPTSCSGNAFEQVKIVSVVVRDSSNVTVYRASTTFDRLSGGNLSTLTSGSLSLTNGGGAGNAYIDVGNYAALKVAVNTPATSTSGDVLHLNLTDGTHAVTPTTKLGTSGAGTVLFDNIPSLQALNDGPITISTWTTNTSGSSSITSITVTKDTVAPSAPSTLALQNGQGSGGAYINNNNNAAVAASVGLGSGSVVTDTVCVTLGDGTSTTSCDNGGTAAALAGAGTVTTTGINASSLLDGSITGSATVKDVAGNSSAAKTASFTKDTTTPAITTFALKDGTGTNNGKVEKGDQIVIVFSRTMSVSTFCSTWTGDSSNQSLSGNGVVVATVTDGTGVTTDKLALSTTSGCTFNLGTIDLGSNAYVSGGSATFSGNGSSATAISWAASTRTLTVTLGTKGGTGTVAAVTSSTAAYTPSSSLSSAAAMSVSGTGSTGNVKNF
jgi:prepilin-type N-terminal cleavage/methylation domain-containing protein